MTFPTCLRLFVGAMATTLLAGCVSTAPVMDRTATAAQVQDKAIVIISVSHDSRAGAGGETLFFMDTGADAVRLPSAHGSITDPDITNDFKDEIGHVYVLQVKPGHHALTHWSMTVGARQAWSPPDMAPLGFDVAPGEVLYVGNVHMRLGMGKTKYFHTTIPTAAAAVVRDRTARDIRIAEATNPAIAGRARVALLPLGPWGREIAPPQQ
jgi:hypothetical protein